MIRRRTGVLVGMVGALVVASAAVAQASPVTEAVGEGPAHTVAQGAVTDAAPGGESGEQISSPTASLTISEIAIPLAAGDDTVFQFGGSLGGFGLADGESVVFAGLAAGSYTVAEILPEGWRFDAVTCLGVEPQVVEAEAAMTITLEQGQPAACTFHNYQEQVAGPAGSLTVAQVTTPAGGVGFSFIPSENLGGPFILDDGGSVVFSELAAGTYTVAEGNLGDDWSFQKVECEALEWDADGSSVTVSLAEGEAAVCTFYSTAGDLPFTGAWLPLPLALLAGLGALVMGLGVVVWSRMRGIGS
jgi:hypothetical protein